MNRSEILIQIEDLMLNICLDRYYWQNVITALEQYREAATNIYDPELEYSPLLQGYFDLMSIGYASVSGRTISPSRSPLQSRTVFQSFCDGLMDAHDHFILEQKRQRKRNFTTIKNQVEDLLDDACDLRLIPLAFNFPYKTPQDIYRFHETLKEFQRRIQNRHDCFKELLDYYWIIEQKRDEGYLCHFLLIYHGSHLRYAEYYCEQIMHMMDDTMGESYPIDCVPEDHHGDEHKYKNDHHHNDDHAQEPLESHTTPLSDEEIVREIFLNDMKIFANFNIEDQYLRARIPGMRCFG